MLANEARRRSVGGRTVTIASGLSGHALKLESTAGQATALMQKDGCAACHSVDKKIVGPAYVDVAAKYKGDKNAQAALVKKVKDGGVGVWGQIPMPPNNVPQKDIDDLVAWILALKK